MEGVEHYEEDLLDVVDSMATMPEIDNDMGAFEDVGVNTDGNIFDFDDIEPSSEDLGTNGLSEEYSSMKSTAEGVDAPDSRLDNLDSLDIDLNDPFTGTEVISIEGVPDSTADTISGVVLETAEQQGETTMVLLKSYTTLDFVIGLLITLGASILNALGLNLVKLAHERAGHSKRSSFHPIAIVGLLLYILSQVIGSTLALSYLRAGWVAPLGSTSLIFNFIFANLLVGTKITKTDILGTLTIVIGVIGVVLFSQQRRGAIDTESNLSLSTIKELWGRSGWLTYLIILEVITVTLFWLSTIADEVLSESQRMESLPTIVDSDNEQENSTNQHTHRRLDMTLETKSISKRFEEISKILKRQKKKIKRSRRNVKARFESWSFRQQEVTVRKTVGFLWAATGGLLAGQSLVFAKSAVKLVSSSFDKNTGNQFASPVSVIILILLAVTSVVQVYCLNKGLQVFDSTLIVPIFYALYTISGFVNSLIYLNEWEIYSTLVFTFIWVSIAVLITGVAILSSKKPEAKPLPKRTFNDDGEEEIEGNIKLDTSNGKKRSGRSRMGKLFKSQTPNNNKNLRDGNKDDDLDKRILDEGEWTIGSDLDSDDQESDGEREKDDQRKRRRDRGNDSQIQLVRSRRQTDEGDGAETPIYSTIPKGSVASVNEFGHFVNGEEGR